MRLLVVGDSHCRNMYTAIKASHEHIRIMVVFKPTTIDQIADLILVQKRAAVIHFDPNFAVIHCGHNNIVEHPVHNRNPLYSQTVIDLQIQLAQDIQVFLPNCVMACSSIFPRTYKHASLLDPKEVTDYNKLAKRYGQRMRASCEINNIRFSLNNIFWKKISKSEEDPDNYLNDGLHLNSVALQAVGREWISSITY
jgi:hypothetical protein